MKVLLVGDKESRYVRDFFVREHFAGVELALSIGDLEREYLEFIVTMLPIPLVYVPGNHDTRYAAEPPGGCTCADGEIVEVCGLKILGLGGCRSSARRPLQYTEREMEKRLKKLRGKVKRAGGVDILLTHAPAKGLGDGEDSFHAGFECFRAFLEEVRPRYHIYGHMHKSYSAEVPPERHADTRLIRVFEHIITDI